MAKKPNQYKVQLYKTDIVLKEGTIILRPTDKPHVFEKWYLEGPVTIYLEGPVYARKL